MLCKRFLQVGLVLAAVTATIGLMTPSANASTTVTIDNAATLRASGAGVEVTGTVTCAFSGLGQLTSKINQTSSLTVSVSQNKGFVSTQGQSTLLNIPCDGTTQTWDALVGAGNTGSGFRRGSAVANANYQACTILNGSLLCEQGSAPKVIFVQGPSPRT